MIPSISRRQALGVLAAPLVAGCRGLELTGPEFNSTASGSAATGGITLIGAGDQHAVTGLHRIEREKTAAMVKSVLGADPGAWAFNAGDLVFNGTALQYSDGYHPSWGAFRERTLFALGNHDRMSDPTARPYYEYTGAERYYARTLGSWRVYVLNTEAADKGGASSGEQTAWLRADIARYSNYHIMAMWHYPMYSNVCAVHRKTMVWPGKVGAWWQVLQDHGAEFVISGHVHRWERFRRLIRSGVRGGIASSRGIRQFVAGTGGGNLYGVLSRDPNCQRVIVARGVARFDLYPDHYTWRFTDTAGVVRDSGTQLCRKVLVS